MDARDRESGVWTVEDVEYRLREAVDTLMRLPFPKHGAPPMSCKIAWPDMPTEAADWWAAYGQKQAETRRSSPAPEAIRRMEDVLPVWLLAVKQPLHRRVIFLRSTVTKTGAQLGWRKIGEALDVSHESARVWYADGVARIAAMLNREAL